MGPYEVNVWITQELYNNEGTTPKEKAKTYIQGAFNQVPHTVSLGTTSDYPAPPTEDPLQSFEANVPCTNKTKTYDSLWPWFKDWLSCYGNEAKDCNLLITNADYGKGGVTGNNKYAAAPGGSEIAYWLSSTYDSTGCSAGHEAMSISLHEMGHSFMKMSGSNEHSVGNVYYDSDGTGYCTPMALRKDGTWEQYCGATVDSSSDSCFQLYWSDCCSDNWSSPS